MALKKADLENLFNNLSQGISDSVKNQIIKPTGRGNQYASRDYIGANALLAECRKVNANFNVASKAELLRQLHPATQYRLSFYTPMLASRYDDLKKPQQDQLFDSKDWVFTEKQNGCRGWLFLTPDGQVHLYSRNYSDVDCSLLDYADNILQGGVAHPDTVAIDVEIKFEPSADISQDLNELGLETSSPLEAMVAMLHTYPDSAKNIQKKFKDKFGKDLICFRLIAPLYYNGVNYITKTLGEGKQVYDQVIQRCNELGFNVKPIKHCDGNREEKQSFLNSIINAGGEGVVCHNIKSSYVTSENRAKDGMVKIKRTIGTSVGSDCLDDSIDAFVTGFKMGSNGTANEGLISAWELSIYVDDNGVKRLHHIASVPNISREVQIQCTQNDSTGAFPTTWTDSKGEVHAVSLNPAFDALVCEVSGQALSSVSQRLEHPRLLRIRPERQPESCIYLQCWLDQNTTNKGITYDTGISSENPF